MSPLDFLSDLYATISLIVRVLLLRFSLFITHTLEFRTQSARVRKAAHIILLIGDGTAEGVGDSIGRTGLTSALNKQLAQAYIDGTIRFPWRVFTRGRLYSSSDDWLPEAELYRNAIIDGVFCNADVVVPIFGMHDDLSKGADASLAHNVPRIVDSLLQRGKKVVLPLPANFHKRGTDPHVANAAACTALRGAVDALREKRRASQGVMDGDGKGSAGIAYNADLGKISAMGPDVWGCEDGFTTFNSRGYRFAAGEVLDDVMAMAKQVEWNYFRELLGAR